MGAERPSWPSLIEMLARVLRDRGGCRTEPCVSTQGKALLVKSDLPIQFSFVGPPFPRTRIVEPLGMHSIEAEASSMRKNVPDFHDRQD